MKQKKMSVSRDTLPVVQPDDESELAKYAYC
jgi:hypothetical protein